MTLYCQTHWDQICAVLWATFCHGLFTWCTLLLRWTCLLNVGNVSWSYQLCLKATSRESPSPPPGHVITADLEVEVTAVEFSPRFIAISYSISSSCGGIKKAYRGTMQIVLASHGGVTFQKCEINLYGSIRLKPPLACHCSNTPPSPPSFAATRLVPNCFAFARMCSESLIIWCCVAAFGWNSEELVRAAAWSSACAARLQLKAYPGGRAAGMSPQSKDEGQGVGRSDTAGQYTVYLDVGEEVWTG